MDFDYQIAPILILLVGILILWLGLRQILSLRARFPRKLQRILIRTSLSIGLFCTFVIIASTTYNFVARLWFHAHHPVPGQSVLVDGRKMYIECTGSGSPTIVLDTGLGNDSTITE